MTFRSALVLSAALAACGAASADPLNPFLWDQMNQPVTQTRAAVKAETLRAREREALAGAAMQSEGATGQQRRALVLGNERNHSPLQASAAMLPRPERAVVAP